MKIGIIGTGNIARGLTKALTHKGYRVMIGGRSLGKARDLAGEMDHFAQGGTIASAVHFGEIVILAIPFKALEETFRNIDSFRGKIVIDCTNILVMGESVSVAFGQDTSAAEQIAAMLPEARVVKAFNTAYSELLEKGPYFGAHDATMFYCGDDEEAKAAVRPLIEAVGFEPMDCGPLSMARHLEPMAALIVQLGIKMGLGREIAFKILQR